MTNPNDNAFPFQRNETQNSVQFGLTKLEYFAGLAMQSLIARGAVLPEVIAENAVIYAKTLIEELNKEDGTN